MLFEKKHYFGLFKIIENVLKQLVQLREEFYSRSYNLINEIVFKHGISRCKP